MNNIPEKYLPLGTVVLLKNGRHRAMIVGYGIKLDGDPNNRFYDYMGSLFPEGIFTSEQSLAFDHSDIDKIFYMGYKDKETEEFMKKLKELMKNLEDGGKNG